MDVIYNGIYSIDFTVNGTIYNTWTAFGLIPYTKPIIMPPEPIISVVNGIPNTYYLDNSEASAYIFYDRSDHFSYENNIPNRYRTGTWKFITDPNKWASQNSSIAWVENYNNLVNILHGKKVGIKLNNYDDIIYTGYIEVSEYSSEDSYSTVSLTYYILNNAYYDGRFPAEFPIDYPEPERPEHTTGYSDKIDYTIGPTEDFVIDQGGGIDIDYEEVPPEVIPEDPDNPEIPDEPTEHYANAVQYATDPEPYTADGWILAKSGYFELNDTIQINDDYYVYKNDADVVPLKSITQSGYGIEYRIHIYTNNPINYNIILYNDYDNSLNNKCYESGINFNSKKYDDCYKIYTNNTKTYTNNPWIYIIPGIKQDIGLELLPNSFSYFIYINTANTAVAVPGQDKFSINFETDINGTKYLYNDEVLVKHGYGTPDTKVYYRDSGGDIVYETIDGLVIKTKSLADTGNMQHHLTIHVYTSDDSISKLYDAFYKDGINYQITREGSSLFASGYAYSKDFYTLYRFNGWVESLAFNTIAVLDEINKKYTDFSYFVYLDPTKAELVD